jgi:23S rRNA (adenine2503-C2)-methyltransferase
MSINKPLIYNLSYSELEAQMQALGQPGFRAKQIWVAIYQNFRTSPHEITTLPKDMREILDNTFSFKALAPTQAIESPDGRTIKTLFKLQDHHAIEAVLMYYDDRRTLCISSQSGCGVGCSFCATGQMGLARNLTSGEIIAQVLYYARFLAENDERVSNLVVMGMGEPFLNYIHVMEALNRLNNPEAFGLGARRISISTVGVVPKIIEFADEGTQYNLAISLHTVDDELRSKLIPINQKYPVNKLLGACRYYARQTSRRVTFEYALIQGVNDSVEDAEALARKIRGMICHVNLIPLNPTTGYEKQGTRPEQVEAFRSALDENNISCTVRLRRGIEIQAGCGQLAIKAESTS